MRSTRSLVLAFFFGVLSLSPAVSEVPSSLCGSSGCEYLVNGHIGRYPGGRERSDWECYDERSRTSRSCNFVRGDSIFSYSDVYRKRDSVHEERETSEPGFLCYR
jgi:hypothetical protein